MMEKKRLVFSAISIVLLLLISACDDTAQASTGAPKTPFIGGSDGVQIKFLEENPPAEVTDQGLFPFQAIVSIKNNGETDVAATDAKLSLGGFLPSLYRSSDSDFADSDLINRPLPDILGGRHRDSEGNIAESVETFVSFPKNDKQFNFKGSIAGNTVEKFQAKLCYKYQTRAVSKLCILKDELGKSDICVVNDPEGKPKVVFSSSSPVQISSLKQTAVGKDKTQFNFEITHPGQGKIFDPTTSADCPEDEANKRLKEDFVKVSIKTGIGTAEQLKCVGLTTSIVGGEAVAAGNVKLINGKRPLTCTQDLPTGRTSDINKDINIVVDFNYHTSTEPKEVLVKHLG